MIGLIILIAWIIILMTRMIAQMCKNTRESKENNHRGAERPCGARPEAAPLLSLLSIVFLHIWAIIHILG